MTDDTVVAETTNYRVRVEPMEGPDNPRKDYDHVCVLTQLNTRTYLQPDNDHDERVVEAWEHRGPGLRAHSTELVERYARAFLDAAAVGWLDEPTSSSRIFGYLTNAVVAKEGIPDPAAYLKAELNEYRDYANGEVYGYVIEEKVHERVERTRPDVEQPVTVEHRDVWEPTDDSCWGFYGYDYAVSEAKSALEGYEKEGNTS